MKKAILIPLFILGFLLIISEGESFMPNIIGLIMFYFTGNELKLFTPK